MSNPHSNRSCMGLRGGPLVCASGEIPCLFSPHPADPSTRRLTKHYCLLLRLDTLISRLIRDCLALFESLGPLGAKCPKVPVPQLRVQMIRVRGVKVKNFVLNGRFDRLYGTKSPLNGFRKSLVIKAFGRRFHDKSHESSN